MLIKLIVIGKVKNKLLLSKINEFQKWISGHAKLEVTELKDCGKSVASARQLEAAIRENGYLFVMDEHGKEFSSQGFAEHIKRIDKKMIFVIGGPDGISDELKQQADTLMALSQMTFTHEMARMFLTEQIYRAISIIKGSKYHRE
ncbi:MAG: 23S rRNA (pseudouridine(1915)-N(3))-methyltransferase RlmH [Victivallaceae bacterium]|nr:23S rRNA (pseudouridine(1915)-N(3))-methyltransferase RlmH [Victivallaceae bacterium]